MKLARFVLKIVGASLAVAGVVCLIVGFWDKITQCCSVCTKKVADVACNIKPRPAEYDDFADVD